MNLYLQTKAQNRWEGYVAMNDEGRGRGEKPLRLLRLSGKTDHIQQLLFKHDNLLCFKISRKIGESCIGNRMY